MVAAKRLSFPGGRERRTSERRLNVSGNGPLTVPRIDRRTAIAAALGFAVLGRARAQGTGDATLIARQLPLDAVGTEHVGTVVPDVTRAARFFARVFNPQVYKERDEPLRYYVTLDPGYVAIGSRANATGAFIDHDCVLVDGYDRAAMASRLEREGLPAGRFGVIPDPDGLGLQLLPIGGLAASTVYAGAIVEGAPLVRPRGLYRVLRYVSDLERSLAFYRKFFGPELTSYEAGGRWFKVGQTYFGLEQVPAGESPRIDRFCVNVAAGGFDAPKVRAALESLGAETRSGGADAILHFRSPEGIGVELRPVDPARIWGRV
jgi:catechol 2,3-dioxygenase-like lactoylglutathione lyase family enzyme